MLWLAGCGERLRESPPDGTASDVDISAAFLALSIAMTRARSS